MERLLGILLLLISITTFGQPSVQLDSKGYYEVVVEIENDNLFQNSINWLNTYYENPDKVLKGKIDSEYLRVSAKHREGNGIPAFDYTLEINLKPNKYRIRYQITELTAGGMTWKFSSYYKADGRLKKMNKNKVERIEAEVHSTLSNHFQYLMKSKEDNDW